MRKHILMSGIMAPAITFAAADMGRGGLLERKDDNGGGTGDLGKEAIAEFMGAFEEFKATNEQAIAEVKGMAGKTDPLTETKLKKINETLNGFESFSQRLQEAEEKSKALDGIEEKFDKIETMLKRTSALTPGGEEAKSRAGDWASAVQVAITQGMSNASEDQQKLINDIVTEYKALSVGNDTQGGFLAPIEFVREITKGVTEVSNARGIVRVRQTSGKAIQVPRRTGQFAAQRVHERGTKSETEGLNYGMDEITAPEMFALIDITNDMLEDGAFNMEEEIQTEATEQFAVKEGKEFIDGSGVGEMEGILTNSKVGETVSGNATEITGDGVIKLKYGIKSAYAANGRFLLNRTTMGLVRTLKDDQGRYIWQPGLADGRPNTIDGDPYSEFPDMPNVGAGAYPIAYGDFRRAYTMLDRIAMELLRDPYTQATGGMVRYIMRRRVGGKLILPEAMRKLKVAAS